MIDRIVSAMKRVGIDAWTISECATQSAELFFIKQNEDIRRAKDVKVVNVTVARDFESEGQKMRGTSSFKVYMGMADEQIESKLSAAYAAAAYVRNPFFELAEPVKEVLKSETELSQLAPAKACDIMAEALFAPDRMDDTFINSAEIFAERAHTRTLTSRGTDVEYTVCKVKGEFVVQCVSPADVEMYFSFDYASPDTLALSELAADALTTVRDRSLAKNAPKAGEYDMILSRKHVATLLSAYVSKANAAMVYAKYSPYTIGCDVQGENVNGEKLNINVFSDEPFSEDGIKMPERELIKDGKLMAICGSTRFCRYLGIEPTGNYECMRVANGSVSFDEMKRKPYIYPVAFSDFQMDEMRGRFGGEIRLAYLFDGENVSLITGGSVSGSLLEKQSDLTFSLERYEDSSYSGPFAVRIPGVSVAGE